jgi:hypothetical protein
MLKLPRARPVFLEALSLQMSTNLLYCCNDFLLCSMICRWAQRTKIELMAVLRIGLVCPSIEQLSSNSFKIELLYGWASLPTGPLVCLPLFNVDNLVLMSTLAALGCDDQHFTLTLPIYHMPGACALLC